MSLFLAEGYPLSLTPESRVLILGQGPLAEVAAQAAGAAGGRPVRLEPPALIGLSGAPGRFTAVALTDQGRRSLTVGAVVLAVSPDGRAPLDPPVLALDQARTSLMPGLKVAILSGFWAPAWPEEFGRVLDLAEAALAAGARPLVFVPQAGVAGPGLEERYRRVREAGAIFTRLLGLPALTRLAQGMKLRFLDPVLGEEASLTADLVAAAPAWRWPAEAAGLAGVLGLSPGPDGWPQPDNVLFPPPLTSRAGVLALTGRGGEGELLLLQDHLDRWLNPAGGGRTAVRAAQDRRICATCLTCLRTCPVKAIFWDGGPVVYEPACLQCGQCAGACPASIIEPDWEEERGLAEALATPGEGAALLLACRRVSEESLAGLPAEVTITRLSCAGRVNEPVLLRLLAQGWGRVVVAACHPGNCRSLDGTERARRVVAQARATLAGLGLEAGRVNYLPLAPHQAERLAAAFGPAKAED